VASLAATAALAAPAAAETGLTAARIVEKNALARGGVDAWRKIQTMAWAGHVESGELPGRNMPFLLEQKRPNSTRFEILAANQKSVRAYDGVKGWKLHPGSNGIPELHPYSPDELRFASGAQAIDGPLMHDVSQNGIVTLGGLEDVAGRSTYALDVQLASGIHHRIWVDAETFLELKYRRDFRNARGENASTEVYYRDYHFFDGLRMPVVIESSAAAAGETNRMVIERVALNPPLDNLAFVAPVVAAPKHHGALVDTRDSSLAGGIPQPAGR
jgi:hypothetical protein